MFSCWRTVVQVGSWWALLIWTLLCPFDFRAGRSWRGGCCWHHRDPINTGTLRCDWHAMSGPAQDSRSRWSTERQGGLSPVMGPNQISHKGVCVERPALSWLPVWVKRCGRHIITQRMLQPSSHHITTTQMWALRAPSTDTASPPSSPHPVLTPQDGPRGDSGWESPGHWPRGAKV